jgi:hypothetical protein
VYYRGPRQTPQPASIKLDLAADEQVVRPPVLRPIAHPYPDALPGSGTVRCYSFEEVFAEKLRAMGQRGRPRDLYDMLAAGNPHQASTTDSLSRLGYPTAATRNRPASSASYRRRVRRWRSAARTPRQGPPRREALLPTLS